jgi:hypothetical protein
MFMMVKKIKIILCSEFSHLSVETFMELIIKLIAYHKNESCLIQSFQYRSGELYLIKNSTNRALKFTNRSIILKEKEVRFAKELRLKSKDLFNTFQIPVEMRRSSKGNLISKIYEFENHVIILSNIECKFI